MDEITLTKDHIKKIIQIYEHFKDIEDFTVTIDGDTASVNFELDELKVKESNRFRPLLYK